MSLIQIGLVDQTRQIDPSLVQEAAAALNIQVVQDLPKYWPISASVQYLSNPRSIPTGVWPVFLVASLPPGEGGFHSDEHNQPFSKVIASPTSEEWTIDASHEIIEMLVDPYGNKMQTGKAIAIAASGNGVDDADGQFSYLVEAADPCEADAYAYSIQGIAVSDFITPNFYDPVTTAGTKYSFTGKLPGPRQLLPGGYISYLNIATNQWEQILWVDPGPPQLKVLGPASGAKSLRLWVDSKMAEKPKDAEKRAAGNADLLAECRKTREHLAHLGSLRGSRY